VKASKPNKKTVIGTVVSDRMDKTITIRWETRKRHPLYKKFVKKHTKIKAHDVKNEASIGDLVKVIETRPVSKDKCWRVIEILEKAQRG
jgi:small subunit ribosomal protein S17